MIRTIHANPRPARPGSTRARRIAAPLLAAVLLLLALPAGRAPVSAESAVQVKLLPSATALQSGQTLVLELHLYDGPDLQKLGPIAIQLDSARFAYPVVTPGPTVPSGFSAKLQDGRLLVSFQEASASKPLPQGVDVLLCTISLQVLDDPSAGATSLALVSAAGFLDADGLQVSAYTTDMTPVAVQLAPSATPLPTPSPTPDPSASPAAPTQGLTPTPEATRSPTPTPGSNIFGPESPSWLWLAFLVALAAALFEFFLLVGRAGRRPARRPTRRR